MTTNPTPGNPATPIGIASSGGATFRPRSNAHRTGRPGGRGRRFAPRTRVCSLCIEKVKSIDYKDTAKLGRYISDRGRIDPRRRSGACAKHQRMLSQAIKRARHLALLPYTSAHISATGGVGIVERPPRVRPEFRRRESSGSAIPPAVSTAPASTATPAPTPVSTGKEQSAQENIPAQKA